MGYDKVSVSIHSILWQASGGKIGKPWQEILTAEMLISLVMGSMPVVGRRGV
jgi:hypothetical protein